MINDNIILQSHLNYQRAGLKILLIYNFTNLNRVRVDFFTKFVFEKG